MSLSTKSSRSGYPSVPEMIGEILEWTGLTKEAAAKMTVRLTNRGEDCVKGMYHQTPEGRKLFESLKVHQN
jgi:ribosomal protein L13